MGCYEPDAVLQFPFIMITANGFACGRGLVDFTKAEPEVPKEHPFATKQEVPALGFVRSSCGTPLQHLHGKAAACHAAMHALIDVGFWGSALGMRRCKRCHYLPGL